MARPRSIPDATVHDAVLALIRKGGDKAVTFAAVAELVGLAASSVAGRYGSVPAMIAAAHEDAWTRLEAATGPILAEAPMAPKGAVRILRQLSNLGPVPVPQDTARANDWRALVEGALTIRLGGGNKGREAAAILFAVWHAQAIWGPDPRISLKDLAKRLIR